MSLDKSVWRASFSRDELPSFPCPGCHKISLKLDKAKLLTQETATSKANQKAPEWEPEWTDEKFAGLLECGAKGCGAIVAISGKISVEPSFEDNEDGGWHYEGMLEPKSMYPPPPIIHLPADIPSAVVNELELAFQFYWGDFGACATKIRTSVERLMDHFKVAKFRVAKNPKNPTARGKLRPLDLSTRIDKFISETGEVVHKDHLHALRVIGNLGTHKDVLTKTEILEAFEIYEHALEELVGKKSKTISRLAKKLSKHKGKPKKEFSF